MANYAVWDSTKLLGPDPPTLSNPLEAVSNTGGVGAVVGTIGANSGLVYYEVTINSMSGNGTYAVGIGLVNSSFTSSTTGGNPGDGSVIAWTPGDGAIYCDYPTQGSSSAGVTGVSAGDVLMVATDVNNRLIWIGVNGGWSQNNPGTGGTIYSSITGNIYPMIQFNGPGVSADITANFGNTAFAYTPPAGYGTFSTPSTTTINADFIATATSNISTQQVTVYSVNAVFEAIALSTANVVEQVHNTYTVNANFEITSSLSANAVRPAAQTHYVNATFKSTVSGTTTELALATLPLSFINSQGAFFTSQYGINATSGNVTSWTDLSNNHVVLEVVDVTNTNPTYSNTLFYTQTEYGGPNNTNYYTNGMPIIQGGIRFNPARIPYLSNSSFTFNSNQFSIFILTNDLLGTNGRWVSLIANSTANMAPSFFNTVGSAPPILSNNNLTVTASPDTDTTIFGAALSAGYVNTATANLYYCELTIDQITTANGIAFGISNSSWNSSNTIGADANQSGGIFVDGSTGYFYYNNTTQSGAPISLGSNNAVIGMLLDVINSTSQEVYYVVNDAWYPNIWGSGGFLIDIPGNLYVAVQTLDSQSQATINFGATPYTYSAPVIPATLTQATGGSPSGVISNNNLTFTGSTNSASFTAAIASGATPGPFTNYTAYFEFTIDSFTTGSNAALGIGFANSTYVPTAMLGEDYYTGGLIFDFNQWISQTFQGANGWPANTNPTGQTYGVYYSTFNGVYLNDANTWYPNNPNTSASDFGYGWSVSGIGDFSPNLYPTVVINDPATSVTFNFGQHPYTYSASAPGGWVDWGTAAAITTWPGQPPPGGNTDYGYGTDGTSLALAQLNSPVIEGYVSAAPGSGPTASYPFGDGTMQIVDIPTTAGGGFDILAIDNPNGVGGTNQSGNVWSWPANTNTQTPHLFGLVANGTVITTYADSNFPVANGLFSVNLGSNPNILSIGGSPSNTAGGPTTISWVLIADRALTSDEIYQLYAWNNKWYGTNFQALVLTYITNRFPLGAKPVGYSPVQAGLVYYQTAFFGLTASSPPTHKTIGVNRFFKGIAKFTQNKALKKAFTQSVRAINNITALIKSGNFGLQKTVIAAKNGIINMGQPIPIIGSGNDYNIIGFFAGIPTGYRATPGGVSVSKAITKAAEFFVSNAAELIIPHILISTGFGLLYNIIKTPKTFNVEATNPTVKTTNKMFAQELFAVFHEAVFTFGLYGFGITKQVITAKSADVVSLYDRITSFVRTFRTTAHASTSVRRTTIRSIIADVIAGLKATAIGSNYHFVNFVMAATASIAKQSAITKSTFNTLVQAISNAAYYPIHSVLDVSIAFVLAAQNSMQKTVLLPFQSIAHATMEISRNLTYSIVFVAKSIGNRTSAITKMPIIFTAIASGILGYIRHLSRSMSFGAIASAFDSKSLSKSIIFDAVSKTSKQLASTKSLSTQAFATSTKSVSVAMKMIFDAMATVAIITRAGLFYFISFSVSAIGNSNKTIDKSLETAFNATSGHYSTINKAFNNIVTASSTGLKYIISFITNMVSVSGDNISKTISISRSTDAIVSTTKSIGITMSRVFQAISTWVVGPRSLTLIPIVFTATAINNTIKTVQQRILTYTTTVKSTIHYVSGHTFEVFLSFYATVSTFVTGYIFEYLLKNANSRFNKFTSVVSTWINNNPITGKWKK